jgi:hypothetical protein
MDILNQRYRNTKLDMFKHNNLKLRFKGSVVRNMLLGKLWVTKNLKDNNVQQDRDISLRHRMGNSNLHYIESSLMLQMCNQLLKEDNNLQFQQQLNSISM